MRGTTKVSSTTSAIKARGEETEGGLAVIEAELGPRSSGTPLHINTLEDENDYVVEGILTFRVGEQTVEGPAGSYVRIPKGVVHTHWNATDAPVKLLGFPAPAGFERFFADFADLITELPPGPPDMSRTERSTEGTVSRSWDRHQAPSTESPSDCCHVTRVTIMVAAEVLFRSHYKSAAGGVTVGTPS